MVEVFVSVPGFRKLPDAALTVVERESEYLVLSTGQVLFVEGEFDDALYLVVSGSLEMVSTLESGQRQLLARFGPSDLIGETVVLFHRPRQSTVYASAPSEVMKLSLGLLATLFETYPSVYDELMNVAARRLLSFHFASSPVLSGIDVETLRILDGESNWIRLPGGETLFKQGDVSDYLYVVVCGRLEVVSVLENGREEVVAYIGRGDCVGEMGLLTGEPRSKTVRAARDTQLVRMSREQFEFLVSRHPQCMKAVAKRLATIVGHPKTAHPKPNLSTIAIVPAQPGPLPHGFMDRLLKEISQLGGPTFHLSSQRIDYDLGQGSSAIDDEARHTRLINWLAEYENRFSHLLLECDAHLSPWTALCVRHSDLILIVSEAQADPSVGEVESAIFTGTLSTCSALKELVLVHSDTEEIPTGTRAWLSTRRVGAHHHVRLAHTPDYERLARFITHKAVGLVFSGGGARGLGHIGAIRALQHCGVPIDYVGGTSMGAAVAAQWARNADVIALIKIGKEFSLSFTKHFWRDLTFPTVALNSARRFTKSLKDLFGELRIEDLWLPYFCTSSDLTNGSVAVHEDGLVWSSIRASSAIPGIWPPAVRDGHMLIDGGVLNNVPVDVMRKRCRGAVIAVDVSPAIDLIVPDEPISDVSGWKALWKQINPFARRTDLPHIFSILSRSVQLRSICEAQSIKSHADLYLQPPTSKIDFFDWKAAYELIDVAYSDSINYIEQWKLKQSYGPYGSNQLGKEF